MPPRKLTNENYFSAENTERYMGSSQYKAFTKCEAAAVSEINGEYVREVSDSMLVGSYVDAWYEGTLTQFKIDHPELFTRSGDLKSQFKHADYMIERASRDKLFSKYMSGKKQVIMKGRIAGVPYKIKIDSYHPDRAIVDLKCMRSLETIYSPELGCRQHFIDFWRYDIQGAIYREIVYQRTGKQLPFYIAAITTEKEPALRVYWVPDSVLDAALSEVKLKSPRFQKIKKGRLKPERCGNCDYCRRTAVLTGVVNYLDELEL